MICISNSGGSHRDAEKPAALLLMAECQKRLWATRLYPVKSALSVSTSPVLEAACLDVAKVASSKEPSTVFPG